MMMWREYIADLSHRVAGWESSYVVWSEITGGVKYIDIIFVLWEKFISMRKGILLRSGIPKASSKQYHNYLVKLKISTKT